MAELRVSTDDGRKLEIVEDSHLYVKEAGEDDLEGVYWEWQKIPSSHPVLKDILEQGNKMVDQVEKMMPDLRKNALK